MWCSIETTFKPFYNIASIICTFYNIACIQHNTCSHVSPYRYLSSILLAGWNVHHQANSNKTSQQLIINSTRTSPTEVHPNGVLHFAYIKWCLAKRHSATKNTKNSRCRGVESHEQHPTSSPDKVNEPIRNYTQNIEEQKEKKNTHTPFHHFTRMHRHFRVLLRASSHYYGVRSDAAVQTRSARTSVASNYMHARKVHRKLDWCARLRSASVPQQV